MEMVWHVENTLLAKIQVAKRVVEILVSPKVK